MSEVNINIILILMDDLGWGDLSCFGSGAIRTPNLDRLAENGAVFRNFYASSSLCTPSRFGLLTGRYPCRGGIEGVFFPTEGSDDLKHSEDSGTVEGIGAYEVTVAELLKTKGYKTGLFGKWHLGDRSPSLPNDKGFDYFYGALYSNDMSPYHFWRNRDIAIEAPVDQRRITEYLNDELFGFIRENRDRPFFAYYASPWPHHPLNCGIKHAGRSKAGRYGDCIEEFDDGVGDLLKLLDDLELSEKTMIVFTSDNGPWHQGSTGGHRGRKANSFDGGQIVPAIFYWKNTIKSVIFEEHAMNIDLMPTFCELTGAGIPEDRIIDGKSLWPMLKGETARSPHDHLVYINSLAKVSDGQAYAVRSRDNFKYYRAASSENAVFGKMIIEPFLFNLNDDPDESYDVKELYPEKYRELKEYLENFRY